VSDQRSAITNEILNFVFNDENAAPPLGGVLDINWRKNLVLDGHPTLDLNYRNLKKVFKDENPEGDDHPPPGL